MAPDIPAAARAEIALAAADELVTDVKLGRLVRRLLQPVNRPEVASPTAGNVVHLFAWLEASVRR